MPGSILDEDPEERERARLSDQLQATITGITQQQSATFEPRVEQRIADEGGKPTPAPEQTVQSEVSTEGRADAPADTPEQTPTPNANASGLREKAESETRAEDAKALNDAIVPIDRAIDDLAAKGQADRAARVEALRSSFGEESVTHATGEEKFGDAKAMYGETAQRTYRADGEVVTGQTERDTVTFRMYTPQQKGQETGEPQQGDERRKPDADGKVLSQPIKEQASPAPEGQYHGSAEAGKKVWSSPVDDPVALSKMSSAELKERGLTPEGLKERYALPEAPMSIADRHHPRGQTLSMGEAAENAMGKGGDTQVEAKGGRTGERNTPGVDWNPTSETWDLRTSAAFNRASNPKEYGIDGNARDGGPADGKSQQTAEAQSQESGQSWPWSQNANGQQQSGQQQAGQEQGRQGQAGPEARGAAGNQPATETPAQDQAQAAAIPDPDASQSVPKSSGPAPAVQPPSDSSNHQQQPTQPGGREDDRDR